MQKLAEVCIRRPVFAAMLILALVVIGATAYFQLGIDRYPAVDIPQVIAFMHETDFDGPVVVEQDLADNSPETPLQLARRNLSYLRSAA